MTKDNADYGLYVHYVRSAIPKCHGYQELHAHSEASFRDAVNKVDALWKQRKDTADKHLL